MKILVGESTLLFRELLTLFLTSRGHEVSARVAPASDGWSGGDAVPDVLLVDDALLVEDCWHEFVQRLRETASPRVFLLTSATAPSPPAREMLGSGVADGVLWRTQSLQEWERVILGVRSATFDVRAGRSARPDERDVGPCRGRDPVGRVLTTREREVMTCLSAGMSTSAMAHQMGVSSNTVHTHVQGALRKLGARSRAEAVRAYLDQASA